MKVKNLLFYIFCLIFISSNAFAFSVSNPSGSAANATQIQSMSVDAPEAADDGKYLYYDHSNTKFDYGTPAGGGDLLADGTTPLTANWDVGAYSITGLRFISDQATGTAPFTVASTTMVDNLNADLLDGEEASAFEDADAAIVKSDEAETITANWDFTANPHADDEVANDITASNYLPLAGGTLTGEVTIDNLGLEFTEGDDHSDCSAFSATGGGIWFDDSEGVFKKCQDGVMSVLDTTGGTPATADISDVNVTQTELAELETIGDTTISAGQWAGLGGATAAGMSLWDDADVAAMLTTLGIDTAANLETSLSLGAFASDLLGYENAAAVIAGIGAADSTVVTDTLGSPYDTEAKLKALMPISQTASTDDAGTLTPTAGYRHIDIEWTPASNPSAISIGETGAIDQAIMVLRNVDGTNVGSIAFAANNFEHNGGAGESYVLNPGQCVIAQYDSSASKWVVIGGTGSMWLSSLEIPNGTDPDVDAAGEVSNDTDGANETGDVSLRGYDGSNQFAFSRKLKCYHFTVVKPNDLADAQRDKLPLWSNESGMTFTVTKIEAWSDVDDTAFVLDEFDGDGASNTAEIDSINCTTGSGPYTATETTISNAAIEANHTVYADFDDTDDPGVVMVGFCGWYNADVD